MQSMNRALRRVSASLLLATLGACAPKVATVAVPPPVEAPPPPPTTPTADVELHGVDGVDEAWAARVRPYSAARSASVQDISDDGAFLLITTTFGETAQLHRVDMPMGARTQLTFREERVRSASLRPGAPDEVVFLSDQGGDEQYQYFHLDLATGITTMLTDGESRNSSWTWSPDGSQAVYSSTARNGRDYDLYRWKDGGSELLLEREGLWGVSEWSPDGRHLSVWNFRSATDTALFLMPAAGGEPTPLRPGDEVAAYEEPVFLGSADRMLVPTDRGQEFRHLWWVEGGEWTNLTADIPWDVEEVAASADGRTAAFVVNQGGSSALYLLDVKRKRISPVEGVPTGLVYGLDFARDAATLAFTVNAATSPGDGYTLDLRTGAVTRWTASEVGGIHPDSFVDPERIAYESFDGKQIPAFVFRPPGVEGPTPVVISIHGGPESQYRPYYSPSTQMMVQLGATVIAPNVRGSAGYGRTWLTLDNGFAREDSVKDIGALLDWIATQPDLDAGRVAVTGGSYGGYMVLASLVHYGDRLVAGVDSVGIANFVTFLENTKEYRRDLRRVEYGDERDPEMRAFLERISPVNRADEIDTALFVVHGANDPRVPVGEAAQIVAAVQESGQTVWYMLAHNEGHGMSRRENRETYRALMAQFLAEQLGLAEQRGLAEQLGLEGE